MKSLMCVLAVLTLTIATAALAAAPTKPCTAANDGEEVQVNVGGRTKRTEFWTCNGASTPGWWELTTVCANGRCVDQ